jgi:hypothetical protein
MEDKSELDKLRTLYSRYGNEDVESMYEKVAEYEDEYDDTYDSLLIGADDVDSADELNAKYAYPAIPSTKLILINCFRVPFKIDNPNRLMNDLSDDEDDDEVCLLYNPASSMYCLSLAVQGDFDEKDQNQKRRDEFVQDPAKVREMQAQRRAAQQARRGGARGGTGARGGHRDVVGAAKGQGQSADVLRNRAVKEKNKNRNRKAMADRKRRV